MPVHKARSSRPAVTLAFQMRQQVARGALVYRLAPW